MKAKLRIPYWPLLFIPAILWGVGFSMNAIVMSANHASMPVLVPDCTLLGDGTDWIHHCMKSETRFSWLADWIVIRGEGIYSLGDLLELACEKTQGICWIIWAAMMIRDSDFCDE